MSVIDDYLKVVSPHRKNESSLIIAPTYQQGYVLCSEIGLNNVVTWPMWRRHLILKYLEDKPDSASGAFDDLRSFEMLRTLDKLVPDEEGVLNLIVLKSPKFIYNTLKDEIKQFYGFIIGEHCYPEKLNFFYKNKYIYRHDTKPRSS